MIRPRILLIRKDHNLSRYDIKNLQFFLFGFTTNYALKSTDEFIFKVKAMVCEGLVLGNFFGIASALSPLWLWNARAVDELFGHWTGLTNMSASEFISLKAQMYR